MKIEPVATVAEVHMSRYTLEWTNGPIPEGSKLYTHPAPTQPALSDGQITEFALSTLSANMTLKAGDLQKFARAIEAHCRGGANHG